MCVDLWLLKWKMEVDESRRHFLSTEAVFVLHRVFPYFKHEAEQLDEVTFNQLKTKRRLLYLKTQSVPRCKHFSSRL